MISRKTGRSGRVPLCTAQNIIYPVPNFILVPSADHDDDMIPPDKMIPYCAIIDKGPHTLLIVDKVNASSTAVAQ
uniref:SFRICE_031654 n=1 Tax=Spodoptera frugiperda TaxID=7108 RepID=A0A2H1W878_SPOFR